MHTRTQPRLTNVPFLGGPISGALLVVCLPPYEERALVWFALVPLFFSLYRNRERFLLRLAHCASFVAVVAVLSLDWLPALSGRGEAVAGARPPVLLAPENILAWGWLGLWALGFALASGPVLRNRRAVIIAAMLPCVWTGLEVLGALLPGGGTGVRTGLLPLGCGVPLLAPEAQVGSLVGIHGLGLAIAGCSTAALLVLREVRPWRQLLLAALVGVVPVATWGLGRSLDPHPADGERFRVLVASEKGGDLQALVTLSHRLEPSAVDLIVWPQVSVGLERPGPDPVVQAVRPAFLRFAETLKVPVVAALTARNAVEDASDDRRIAVIAPRGSSAPGAPPRLSILGPAGPGREGIVRIGEKKLGVIDGSGGLSAFDARSLTQRGATLLVASSSERRFAGGMGYWRIPSLERFRAIENRRWVVRSGPWGALVAGPCGEVALRVIAGLEGAAVEDVELLEAESLYTTAGWWIEPLCVALCGLVMIWGLLADLRRRRLASYLV